MMPEQQQPPAFERRSQMPCADHEKRISLTEQAVMSIKQTSEGMTTKLDLILAQITRVAILEEKHSTQQIDVTRAHAKIEAQEGALQELARESREFIAYTKGQGKTLGVISVIVLGLFIKVVFFAASNGMTP